MDHAFGYGLEDGAAVLMFGRYGETTLPNDEGSRVRLRDLAKFVGEARESLDIDVVIGVERYPDPEVAHLTAIEVKISIGLRLNSVRQGEGMRRVAGKLDAHRESARALDGVFWSEASERAGTPLGTVAKPTSAIGPSNSLRPTDEPLLVHASMGLGCRYAVGVECSRELEWSDVPRSIQGMRRAYEQGICGYHRWAETTTQLNVRDRHRKRMAEAMRQHGEVFAWLGSVPH